MRLFYFHGIGTGWCRSPLRPVSNLGIPLFLVNVLKLFKSEIPLISEVNDMGELKVVMPEELMHRIAEFPDVDWSATARRAISKKARQLAFLKYFASESELTEEDALELGKKVNEAVSRRYKELM